MVGTTLNHYRIVRSLGSGGMGEVYLADDSRLKRSVAIKILPPALAAQPERRERFAREGQAVAALNHANIVTVYSVESDGDTHFLTMEYVDGQTLGEVLPRGGMPLKRLLHIARQIVDAVIAAHERGIVHRDLKPANVMVDARDRVKVLDFGLAKLREPAEADIATAMPTRELTGEGRIVGTVAYMSPEQAEGKPVDERSDIFSLGVILYEMATGMRPFSGDTSMAVLSAILRDTPKPVNDLNPSLPSDLARIVRHCLAKDPERRYQSAKDLRNDLEELIQTLDSGSLDIAAAPQPARAARRPSLAAAAVVGALVTVAAAAALWPRTDRSAAPPTATHQRLTEASGAEQYPALSPDGKWIVYAKAGDLFLQSVTGQTAINLTNDAASANQMPAFSPDGELIAFRSNRAGGGLFVMGRTGESVRRLSASGYYPAWFPNGRQIVYTSNGVPGPESVPTTVTELWVASTDGGEPRQLYSGRYASQPRVSPNGRRIAFWGMKSDAVTDRYNRDIWTIDLDGRNPVRATTHEANDWNPIWSPDARWLYFLSNRAGSMNLWRVAIDEGTGVPAGAPQALTAPAQYVSHFTLSADGRVGAYASLIASNNIGMAPFDLRTGTAGPVRAVTTGARAFDNVDVSGDGRSIAATSTSRAQEDVYVIPTDGGAARQLTSEFARDRAPRWSPDGRRIYFYSERGGNYDVWAIESDGSNLRRVTQTAWRGYPVPSPDGSRLIAVDINDRQLYIHDLQDPAKPPEVLPPFPVSPESIYGQPNDWSRDGRAIALIDLAGPRSGVWLYSLDSKSYRRIADAGGGFSGAKLTSDGRHVVFARVGRLWIADIAAATVRELLAIEGESLSNPRLTADDSQLVFLRAINDADVWLVRFEDQK
jgi:Tol biopolymer transport system component/predicted Ser/Thr protein kinase